VWGFGFIKGVRVKGLGLFRVQGFRYKILDLKFRVQVLGFRFQVLGFRSRV
jgi:hypothetical protein